jgi:GNAT superfamily N-acetyltransferase
MKMCEGVERQAVLDLWRAGQSRGASGFHVHEGDAAFVLTCPSHPDCVVLNRAMSGASDTDGERWLEQALAHFESAGAARFLLQPPPSIAGLEDVLRERGYERFRRRWAKFVRRRQPVARAETDLFVVPVEARHASTFGRILANNLAFPPHMPSFYAALVGRANWHGFVALDGDEAVAAGAMFVHDGVAYLAGGATNPTHRRRGAQRALLAARLDQANQLGCRWAVSETGEAVPGEPNHSYNNLLRAGFEVVYSRANFVGPTRAGGLK